MGCRTLVIWCLISLMFLGCATVGNHLPPWRKPGQKMLDGAETVWVDYNCQNENLPLIQIERNELIPLKFNPNKKMLGNHRLIYGLCSNESHSEIVGQLYTRFYHRGRIVGNDVDENYVLKPGRWLVDTFITIPSQAEQGVYTLEVEFKNPDTGFKVANTFIVGPKEK